MAWLKNASNSDNGNNNTPKTNANTIKNNDNMKLRTEIQSKRVSASERKQIALCNKNYVGRMKPRIA